MLPEYTISFVYIIILFNWIIYITILIEFVYITILLNPDISLNVMFQTFYHIN
jgi:hypothetical protein